MTHSDSFNVYFNFLYATSAYANLKCMKESMISCSNFKFLFSLPVINFFIQFSFFLLIR